MADLYAPTDAALRAWAGDQSFTRGNGYFRDGAITNPRRQGNMLKAQCYGSSSTPYRVEVTLGNDAILTAHCSCPVGGHCKHVVALLLTWRNAAHSFAVIEELTTALNRRSKEELVALIKHMVGRYPDLGTLLELPMPGGARASKPVEPAIIERQVAQVFRGWAYEYGESAEAATQLEKIRQLGVQYAGVGDWHNAVTVYRAVATGTLEHYELDEEGELGTVVDDCVIGLGEALAALQEGGLRETILQALFEIYRWDIDAGGYGVGDAIPELLTSQTTPAEKRTVAEWVRATLPQGSSWSDGYHRQTYGGLLLALEADTLDDESFLRICRETGRVVEWVGRLLELNRVDEAVAAAREASDYELLRLAQLFAAAEEEPRFAQVVRERVQVSQDQQLKTWLRNWLLRSDPDQALVLTQELFWAMPSLERYQELKQLAETLQRWSTLRPRLIERLRQGSHAYVLTKIHLYENEIDEALAAVRQPPTSPYRISWGHELRLEVAAVAARTRPEAALAIYQEEVTRQIDARSRGHYAQAATLLHQMRPIYEQMNRPQEWTRYVITLREKNSRLRALHDEWTQAGLPDD